jgi:5-methylcytosine-specific restriction endonuclease McrA
MQHKDRLSDEERQARRRETTRRYREKNREKCVAASLASRAKKPDHYSEKNRDYKADPGYIERQREYRVANRDKLTAKTMEWRVANRAKYDAYQQSYSKINGAKSINRAKRWRGDNVVRARVSGHAWRQKNKYLLVIKEQRRRARIKEVGGNLSPDIHAILMKLQKGKCAVCRTSLRRLRPHIDHIMPIAKGGENTDKNVQLLCSHCNACKHAKHPVDFMQERGFLC